MAESSTRTRLLAVVLTRGQALFMFAAAVIWLSRWPRTAWTLGVAASLVASGLLFWNVVQMGSPDSGETSRRRLRRTIVALYLVSVALILVSILGGHDVAPAVVVGSGALGMALLIGLLPFGAGERPAA